MNDAPYIVEAERYGASGKPTELESFSMEQKARITDALKKASSFIQSAITLLDNIRDPETVWTETLDSLYEDAQSLDYGLDNAVADIGRY